MVFVGIVHHSSPQVSEFSELREMLKAQQNQLNQLIQIITQLQGSKIPNRFPHNQSVFCRRCQKSGHFARECNGERFLPAYSVFGGTSYWERAAFYFCTVEKLAPRATARLGFLLALFNYVVNRWHLV